MKSNMHGGAGKELYPRARELRNRSTHAEDILWGYLKTKPRGHKFRRQHPYAIYVLDFYCHKLKLIIEVDGSIHHRKDIKANDQLRQQLLEQDGMKVLRLTNEQILSKPEDVIVHIEQYIHNINEQR